MWRTCLDSAWLKRGAPLVLLAALIAGPAQADEWNENYDRGLRALERSDWPTAIASLQTALRYRSDPHPEAMTSNLKLVQYLPYFYLGQAFLFAGDYASAMQNFQRSEEAGAIGQTEHYKRLLRFKDIAQSLLAHAQSKRAPHGTVNRLQNLIAEGQVTRAEQVLSQLKRDFPEDDRWSIFERWLQSHARETTPTAEATTTSRARDHFQRGLNHYLLGQYVSAVEAFETAVDAEPNFGAANDWLQRTRAELQRLSTEPETKTPSRQPEVVEVTVRETIAPVVVLQSPAEVVSEVRSEHFMVKGQAGDDQGVANIAVLVNGEPVADGGEPLVIRPAADADPRNFSFAAHIPLKPGENQVALIASDVDSVRHETRTLFTVVRMPPIYKTSPFAAIVGGLLILILGAVAITRIIKYRIAVVHKYNPYIAGAPIRNSEMFFGREKLLNRILNTLHNNSVMIYGPRRIGKTSLLYQIKQRLQALSDPEYTFLPAMIDLQGTSEEHFFATMIEEILETCKPHLADTTPLQFNGKRQNYGSRQFTRDLRTVLYQLSSTTSKKLKLVLLIDEVDELNKYSEQVNQKLRSVFMKTFAERLVAVMSGSYIRKTWTSEGSPWYNFFEEIQVPPLDREEARQLILEPVRGMFRYDEAAVERILEYSACRPYDVQRLCINAINHVIEQKRRRVRGEDIEQLRPLILTSEGPAVAA